MTHDRCCGKYEACNKPLETLWILPEDASANTLRALVRKMGFFKLNEAAKHSSNKFDSITHITGKVCPLPQRYQTQAWTIENNMDFHNAIMKHPAKPLETIPIKEIFKAQGIVIPPPDNLPECPEPVTRPRDPGFVVASPRNDSAVSSSSESNSGASIAGFPISMSMA